MRREIRDGTVTLKHVQTVRKGDRVHRYLRIPGQPRLRLPDLPPDHPDFLLAYAQAMAEAPARAGPGTIRAAIDGLIRSRSWAALSPGYRMILRRHLGAIRIAADDARIAHLRTAHIQVDLRALTDVQKRDRLKAWRQLCRHALAEGMIEADPSEGVRRTPLHHTSHPVWTPDQITVFRARWPIGTVQRAVMELLFWTGARIGDACRIGPGMVGRDGVLAFRQQKTGDMAYVPWTAALPAYAAGMKADRDLMHAAVAAVAQGHMTWLATANGTRSHKSAGHLIAHAAAAAGFDRSAHGLRAARAVALAEAGANPLQIGAWTGHHSLSEVAHYVAEADRRRHVMGTEQDGNSVNPSKPAVNTGAGI